MIRFIAGFEFTVLAISLGCMLLSIARPDLRTWPKPRTTPWPRPLLAIVGWLGQLGMPGLLLLGVLDWNSLGLESWSRSVGGVLFAVGGFWGFWGYRTLGAHLSMGNEGDLIDTGAYRHCRNPQYIGAIASSVGYALICDSTLALVGSAILAVTFMLMPFAEEPWLREGLGAAYEAYFARVPRFIPSFPWRGEMDDSTGDRNRQLVRDFWQAVYEERDEARIGSFFNEDGRYEDAALPGTAGVGPKGAARRLAIGHARIESFDHEVHRVVAEGDTVVTEHTATWHFHTGEVVPLPFVSIHVVRAGKFDLWRDYWDLGTWVAAAPRWWVEDIMKAGADGFES